MGEANVTEGFKSEGSVHVGLGRVSLGLAERHLLRHRIADVVGQRREAGRDAGSEIVACESFVEARP